MRRWVTVKEAAKATTLSVRTVRDHSLRRDCDAFIRPLEVCRVMVDLERYQNWLMTGRHGKDTAQ